MRGGKLGVGEGWDKKPGVDQGRAGGDGQGVGEGWD